MDFDGNGEVTLSEYKKVMLEDPSLFGWFEILNNVSRKVEQQPEENENEKEKEKESANLTKKLKEEKIKNT